MCLKTCHFAACFTILWTSIYVFYFNTARDIVTVLLIFAKYLSFYLHIFTCTYRGTLTQAHMYNQHTREMATTRHRSPVERGGKNSLLETLHIHTQKIYVYIYCVCVCKVSKKFFLPPLSSRLLCLVVAIPLVCWLYMCACVCVCLCMCMWKCVGKVINI